MKVQIFIRKRTQTGLVLCCLLLTTLLSTPGNATPHPVLEKIGLEEAFLLISEKYHAYFNYDRSIATDIEVDYKDDIHHSLDQALSYVLKDTDLGYRIYDQRYVVVFQNNDAGIKSLKSMIGHMQGLVQEKEESKRRQVIPLLPRLQTLNADELYNKRIVSSVTGTVTDEAGEPLIGVNIQVKGTNKGVATDFEGRFSIEDIDENAVLVVSYIGYQTQEVMLAGKPNLTITLLSDSQLLDEVVVVGYNAKKRSELTSAVSIVSGEEIQDVTSNSVSSLLQGKAPGVIVSNSSGDPTANSSVLIRGTGSISAGSAPLYVVDGIIGGSVNPKDVETITVLKDAAAVGLYGSRASNGVIVITTKSGKSGKTEINFGSKIGFNKASTGNFEVMNSEQLYDFQETFFEPQFFESDRPKSLLAQDTDWPSLAFRTGMTQNYNLSLSGGSESTTFYLSGDYYQEEGTLHNNGITNYNLRTNISHEINSKLKVDLKINAKSSEFETETSASNYYSVLYAAFTNLPWDNPYNSDGKIRKGIESDWLGRVNNNFLYEWQYNFDKGRQNLISGDVNFRYQILPNLSFSTFNRVNYNNRKSELYYDKRSVSGQGKGRLTDRFTYGSGVITSNRLQYDFNLGNHLFQILGVGEAEKNFSESNSTIGENLTSGLAVMDVASNIISSSGNKNDYVFSKLLSQVDYSFQNKYFLIGSFIRESSSRFGANNRAGNFYTLGTSWILNNEDFATSWENIDLIKIRASFGVIGNAQIGNYQTLGLYSYNSQYAGQSASFPSNLPNPNLTWEKAKTANIGFDISFYKRISLNFDIYDKTTDDLLLNTPLPYTSGYSSIIQNVGSVRNRGLEFNLTTDNFVGEFTWKTNFNVSINRNKVLKLYEDNDIIAGPAGITSITRVGEALDTWYLRKWVGVDPENGDPLWEKIDENSTTTTNNYSEATPQILSSYFPKFTGGFFNEVSYKGFKVSAFLNFVSGNMIFNRLRQVFDSDGTYPNFNHMVLAPDWKRWEQPGDIATHPKTVFGGNNNSNGASSRFLEDGSYIRLRNVRVSYNLSRYILANTKFKNAHIFVSGDNLWTGTEYSGIDPEVTIGTGDGTSFKKYPLSKKVLFGINIQF